MTKLTHVPTFTLSVHDVVGGNTSRLDTLLEFMRDFFPHLHKLEARIRRRAALAPDADPRFVVHQWLIEVNGDPAGFCLFQYMPSRDCGLMLFVAVKPEYRNIEYEGYSRMMPLLIAWQQQTLQEDALRLGRRPPYGLLTEIEVPALVSRYRDYGFRELPVAYYEPTLPGLKTSLGDEVAVDMLDYERVTLGIFPAVISERELNDSDLARHFAAAFLVDYYGLPETSWPMQQIQKSVRPQDTF